MAVMTIRNIDDVIKNRLRLGAAMHGRSMKMRPATFYVPRLRPRSRGHGTLGKRSTHGSAA
jgi:hypothetical protein